MVTTLRRSNNAHRHPAQFILFESSAPKEAVPQVREYWDVIREEYSEETPKTRHHIIVYALLIRLFKVFLPEEDIDDFVNEDWSDYVRALEIAKEEGPENIIEEFRESVEG